ncbi:UDP-N-acetylmuramoyl-L-alanine--D-glutamate ligase [Rhodococcus sp. D2-41]|uniref:UDP-N-acetylmuramoyl-L-alanine--D-glutamate ligase n=1 Tax=Speluncibacter jeojiensis TaxID=2710754 RepID=UPI0024100844|nr:UDP-N-acetylmuramoyl-L-alanine--D-glutamate ligase [Rhodococcus sp. D2-41]MDG3011995.1 UDP-N-acetylmuramoyl-L-alanine--D-glutamate ligase [Rhodococcus sp. D2-41]
MTGPRPGPGELGFLDGAHVFVTGAGVSGRAAARALIALGARVSVVDANQSAAVAGLEVAVLTPEQALGRLGEVALVVTSPGWRPDAPLLTRAAELGVPVWGDVELAWRMDRLGWFGAPRRWLAVTGTNGKTTTTTMLDSILRAAGLASAACGNIGLPVLDALAAEPRAEVLAVELSSFQLHWAPSVHPEAGVVLNIAEDHLDWHGGMDAYAAAKARVLTGRVGAVGLDDPVAAGLAAQSPAETTVGFRLGEPAPGELGVVGDELVDRAFGDGGGAGDSRSAAPVVLARVDQVHPGGPPGLLDALAAASLARAIGVPAQAVAAGLDAHEVGPHRSALVVTVDGVGYVDDSKATNPHAARASILAHPRVVWLAGGLLKGASVDELVAEIGPRLAGAVLIGRDRGEIAAAMSRHAPEVPVVEVFTRDDASVGTGQGSSRVLDAGSDADQVMLAAVASARELAHPGDTVLLAPAAASLDMFADYGHRGRSFAHAALQVTADS